MKTLRIKRVFAYIIQKRLKDVPPKIYPSTAEIKTTTEYIIPAFREHAAKYDEFVKGLDKVRRQERRKKIKSDEASKRTKVLQEQWNDYNDEHGEDVVSVKLEDEAFKTLLEQFEREDKSLGTNDVWGKSWAVNIDEFMELTDAFSKAESGEEDEPKESDKNQKEGK